MVSGAAAAMLEKPATSLLLSPSLWEILQIVSIASMEQIALPELLASVDTRTEHVDISNQLEINYS